jgi:hypothetical protein
MEAHNEARYIRGLGGKRNSRIIIILALTTSLYHEIASGKLYPQYQLPPETSTEFNHQLSGR